MIVSVLLSDDNIKTTELARIHSVAPRTIRKWRHWNDIPSIADGWGNHYETIPMKRKTKSKKIELPKCEPEVWDNEAWFREMYEVKGYGSRIIARAINRHFLVVQNRLKKYKIKPRSSYEACKSKNPCCNAEWVEQNYVINKLPIEECARRAGIYPHTFYDWLVKFKIDIRDRYDPEVYEGVRERQRAKKQTSTASVGNADNQSRGTSTSHFKDDGINGSMPDLQHPNNSQEMVKEENLQNSKET